MDRYKAERVLKESLYHHHDSFQVVAETVPKQINTRYDMRAIHVVHKFFNRKHLPSQFLKNPHVDFKTGYSKVAASKACQAY